MSTIQDFEFHKGEDWIVAFEINDGLGEDIDISGATINFRVSTLAGTTLMTRTEADGFSIESGATGLCTLRVTSAHQTTGGITASTRYQWELRVTTQGGLITVQGRGHLNVLPSLLAA